MSPLVLPPGKSLRVFMPSWHHLYVAYYSQTWCRPQTWKYIMYALSSECMSKMYRYAHRSTLHAYQAEVKVHPVCFVYLSVKILLWNIIHRHWSWLSKCQKFVKMFISRIYQFSDQPGLTPFMPLMHDLVTNETVTVQICQVKVLYGRHCSSWAPMKICHPSTVIIFYSKRCNVVITSIVI